MVMTEAVIGANIPDIVAQFALSKVSEISSRYRSSIFDKVRVSLEIGFNPFLEKTYVKCRYYKTILNSSDPCDLMETYVNVSLDCNNDGNYVTDSKLICDFLDGGKYVITGLAGCGKSMFMRYAALKTFESSSALPLFVELRKLNNQDKKVNFLEFIYQESRSEASTVTFNAFKLAIKSGLFAIILDGFDEIEYDLRKYFSDNLQDFVGSFPKCPIIVSSRPDQEAFRSWNSFKVYQVEKFDQRQTLQLVENAKYDEGVKIRFIEALNKNLFNSHASFLQSPLLTIIMLFTFEEYAEIPRKMHSFYSRAFDTLFQKHDADKEQFVRKIKSKLSREDFKLVLSSFCAISYLEEKFEFSRGEIENYIEKGIGYSQKINPDISADGQSFLGDMKDAVCLIQEDGLNLVFVHRSFQEYFSAVFLSRMHSSKIFAATNKFSQRINDNVIPMALDISRETLEQEWLIPTLKWLIKELDLSIPSNNLGRVVSKLFPKLSYYLTKNSANTTDIDKSSPSHPIFLSAVFPQLNYEFIGPLFAVCNETKNLSGSYIIRPFVSIPVHKARSIFCNSRNIRRKNCANFKKIIENETLGCEIYINKSDDWWLKEIGADNYINEIVDSFKIMLDECSNRLQSRSSFLNDLL